MVEINPPNRIKLTADFKTIFLAGSIEQDKADDWQKRAIDMINENEEERTVIFNPRRKDYDAKQEQSMDNPYFWKQVNWELDYIDLVDFVIMYFDPKTKSPITLMELGYMAKTDNQRLVVVCPQGFWRKGNVDIMCWRNNIPRASTLTDAVNYALHQLYGNKGS